MNPDLHCVCYIWKHFIFLPLSIFTITLCINLLICMNIFRIMDRKTGRAGAPLLDVKVKLVNWEEGNYLITDRPNPRGEIHIGGDNVALGYYKNEQKTEEDFYDSEGLRWFRTGDIGEFDPDGVIR